MEYIEHYDNMEMRNKLCDIANSNGYHMLHDNFDENWKRGDEPHGTLIFTDEEAPQAPLSEPARDLAAEIDGLRTGQDKINEKLNLLLKEVD